MSPVLMSLNTYLETNPLPPVLNWPTGKITRRAKAVQYKIEMDQRNACSPRLTHLASNPQYVGRNLLMPMPTWELAVRIEMAKVGITTQPAAKIPPSHTTARSFAVAHSRNQSPGYLRRVGTYAATVDPAPAGPYNTRHRSVWSTAFLKIRPGPLD